MLNRSSPLNRRTHDNPFKSAFQSSSSDGGAKALPSAFGVLRMNFDVSVEVVSDYCRI
jgi:hypothetical protein